MTREVKTASPETPLHDIADTLEESHIKRVPIVSERGELIGIVSRANIIQAVATTRPKLEISVPDAEIRQTLLEELKRHSWARVHRLNVTVTDGTVNLWGFVQSEVERRAITIAAEAIPGVTGISDHLRCEEAGSVAPGV
jgi:osmotically-inducible protein OsmY